MDNVIQEQLARMFSTRFEEYNTLVLKELAEVIKRFKTLKYSDAHKLAQQLKYNKSYIDILNDLSDLTGKSKKDLEKMLEEVAKQDIEFADKFYKAKNMKTPIYENTPQLQSIVKSVSNLSDGDFINIAKSTGFRLLDDKGKPLYLDIKETYYKVIDDCIYAVQTGQENYDTVIRKTINQLADSGVRKIEYNNKGKAVYSQRIDTAVRRNVMDSIRQVTIETNKILGDEYGYDGWEITVHSNPAPDHAEVQGHQFDKDEFDKFQSDQDCRDVEGVWFPAEHEGRDRRSIGEYNCYHNAFPILVGIEKPLHSKKELQEIIEKTNEEIDIDGKKYNRYEITQLQRQIETEIRKAKDKQIMFKETDDKIGILKEQKRITQLTRKYKEISKKADIPEQLDRARVSGYKRVSVKNTEL